jgi:long-chain acyl-CoA synthetase
VAILLGNGTTFVEAFIGATHAPNVCALLDPKWPQVLLRDVLRRLEPDLVIIDGAVSVRTINESVGGPVLQASDNVSECVNYESWIAAQVPVGEVPEGADDDAFLVTFTSGTTSTPKAIRRDRRSWRASLSAGPKLFGLGQDCSALAPGPLAHGLTHYALAEQLRAGATFHGLPRYDAGSALATLRSTRITRLVAVPTMLEGICRMALETGAVLKGLKTIVTAGAKLEDGLSERTRRVFPDAKVIEYYGASELGFVTVAMDRENARDAGVGHPFPGVELAIRTPDGLTRKPGVTGTVTIRSPLVSAGYLWGEDGVGLRIEGGWATVGDIGRLDETGALHLIGREGGMILTGAHNVFPSEVEAALLTVLGIEQAIVLGIPDAYLGQIVVAIVSGPAVARADAAEILAVCAERLPRFKLPRQLFSVRDWPLTNSGKVARGTLETWILEADARIQPLPS